MSAASTLGCSVTPVREALVTLRGEGLVHQSPHRGFIVETLDRGDITDIFWSQGELSSRLATHAADNPNLPAVLTRLQSIVDDLAAAVDARDDRAVLSAEFEFHRQVHIAANSKKLAWFQYAASKYNAYQLYARDLDWGHQAVASHRRLIGFLGDGDTDAIRTEIHGRFAYARDRLIAQLETIGFFDDVADAPATSA